mgnify:CR=1 FL=1
MAIDDIIKENLHVVETLAYKYAQKCPGMTADDFIGEGNMALVIAARKWNPDKEPVFAHYAVYHIRKAMERIMPTGEIKKEISDKMSAGRPYTHEAVENAELNEDMHQRLQRLNDRERNVICHYYGIEGKEKLTMAEIAELLNYSRERIRQIRKTAERKMRKLTTLLALILFSIMVIPAHAQMPPQQPEGFGVKPTIGSKDPKAKGKKYKEPKPQKVKKESAEKLYAKTIYLYGVGFSAVDSVVYFTDEQRLDSMLLNNKKFLKNRAVLSEQFTNYLTSIGESKYTGAIVFDTNLKKLDKKFLKHANKYKKQGYTIKAADKSQFSFSR